MFAVNVYDLELAEARAATLPGVGCRVAFPISAATGAAASAAVYFEVAPGERLGRHADSAEEIILVLSGEAEAEVGEERGRLGPGGLALIPAMVPHDVHNVGAEPVRVVGFFAGAALVHRFFEFGHGSTDVVIIHGPAGEEALTVTPMGVPAPV